MSLASATFSRAPGLGQTSNLASQLRALVKDAVALLGNVIREQRGSRFYEKIEAIRREMAGLRFSSEEHGYQVLSTDLQSMRILRDPDRYAIAHAFALMLELINSCENAYRTHRLRNRPYSELKHQHSTLVYVLTAHPTEARSSENIALFHQIQKVLIGILDDGFGLHSLELKHLLSLAWHLPLSREQAPTVEDEADHIYSIILEPEILTTLTELSHFYDRLEFRSWVGGDKDGHPGVNQDTFRNSLNLSRCRLLKFVQIQIDRIQTQALWIKEPEFKVSFREIQKSIKMLYSIRSEDGLRVSHFWRKFEKLQILYQETIGASHPSFRIIEQLKHLFPGLVVPLEIRESSDILMSSTPIASLTVTKILKTLKLLSQGGDCSWYARSFIISMASDVVHMKRVYEIQEKVFGELQLPIVPLLEQANSLKEAPKFIEAVLRDPQLENMIRAHGKSRFEVMVGYSDSAKESGVLASRVEIGHALHVIDQTLRKSGITPVFFHGSGGSVDRGGGTIEEQTSWWPRSALQYFKTTIQGEMVERLFSSPEIFKSQLFQVAEQFGSESRIRRWISGPSAPVVAFSEHVKRCYQQTVHSPEFLNIVQKATLYRYLRDLKIGSRPSKRNTTLSLSSLRAIPWVLCWTQSRVLFPTWWGIGTAWEQSSTQEKAALKVAFERDLLWRAYLKALGFTLAKVELQIWRLVLDESPLSKEEAQTTYRYFSDEYIRAVRAFREITGQRDFLWHRPWLGTSIRLRSPMIHPLNLLQLSILKRGNPLLLRETVTGISSGMLTTG